MKKYLLLAIAAFSSSSFAGTAYIAEWRQHSHVHTCFNVSNTSNVDVGVTIKLYDQNGDIFTGTTTQSGKLNSEFTLTGKSTIQLCVPASSNSNFGFGTITSRPINESDTGVFLVARGVISDVTSKNKWQTVTINGGNPF
ncbi:hypothetical protein [Pseudoalteromonas piscicida]|uniref:hypothetical protein n=1 Tax=Pseudoalteromonas piscicida TaxID=43662 RepID=UPI000E35EDAB|nr:hypothetical protein [Pseudoalteromonas piscicida]AXQ97573.1 hypothetical protein D0N37_07280 [Pseudoalteromonas piscicida]